MILWLTPSQTKNLWNVILFKAGSSFERMLKSAGMHLLGPLKGYLNIGKWISGAFYKLLLDGRTYR
jgi:hypothetical protein